MINFSVISINFFAPKLYLNWVYGNVNEIFLDSRYFFANLAWLCIVRHKYECLILGQVCISKVIRVDLFGLVPPLEIFMVFFPACIFCTNQVLPLQEISALRVFVGSRRTLVIAYEN